MCLTISSLWLSVCAAGCWACNPQRLLQLREAARLLGDRSTVQMHGTLQLTNPLRCLHLMFKRHTG
jgi:hypothetical protein